MRTCAYPPCERLIPEEARENKLYCHPRHRTAHWKARRAAQGVSGVVAVRALGPSPGDAQNARTRPESKRASQLRQARERGTVANDLRLQHSRAVAEFEATLRYLNLPFGEAARLARRAADRALPVRLRP